VSLRVFVCVYRRSCAFRRARARAHDRREQLPRGGRDTTTVVVVVVVVLLFLCPRKKLARSVAARLARVSLLSRFYVLFLTDGTWCVRGARVVFYRFVFSRRLASFIFHSLRKQTTGAPSTHRLRVVLSRRRRYLYTRNVRRCRLKFEIALLQLVCTGLLECCAVRMSPKTICRRKATCLA